MESRHENTIQLILSNSYIWEVKSIKNARRVDKSVGALEMFINYIELCTE